MRRTVFALLLVFTLAAPAAAFAQTAAEGYSSTAGVSAGGGGGGSLPFTGFDAALVAGAALLLLAVGFALRKASSLGNEE